MWSVICSLAVALVHLVIAEPDGVPMESCQSMAVHHGGRQPLKTPMPYHFTLSPSPGSVRISMTGGFAGFMVQARADNSILPLGTFTNYDKQMKTIRCTNENDTASHTNSDSKAEVSMTWIPPSKYSGKIIFYATMAEGYKNFWVYQEVGSIILK